jgi:prephenate dehydratase
LDVIHLVQMYTQSALVVNVQTPSALHEAFRVIVVPRLALTKIVSMPFSLRTQGACYVVDVLVHDVCTWVPRVAPQRRPSPLLPD